MRQKIDNLGSVPPCAAGSPTSVFDTVGPRLPTPTAYPAKVVFKGRQTYAYRFVLCVLEEAIVGRDQVVRHRCHNRLCLNPEHLQIGSQADNKRDDWEFAAGGVDFDFL